MTDTFAESIALSSPSGRMSRRARRAAEDRLAAERGPLVIQRTHPSEREVLLRQAAELRDLARRGFRPRLHTRRADELERQAATASATPVTETEDLTARSAPRRGRRRPERRVRGRTH